MRGCRVELTVVAVCVCQGRIGRCDVSPGRQAQLPLSQLLRGPQQHPQGLRQGEDTFSSQPYLMDLSDMTPTTHLQATLTSPPPGDFCHFTQRLTHSLWDPVSRPSLPSPLTPHSLFVCPSRSSPRHPSLPVCPSPPPHSPPCPPHSLGVCLGWEGEESIGAGRRPPH